MLLKRIMVWDWRKSHFRVSKFNKEISSAAKLGAVFFFPFQGSIN